jgi:type IV pilus assembly protein PilO
MVLRSREKILLVLVFIAIAIWAFDQFYYTPQSRKISRLKDEVKAAELKLKELILLEEGVKTTEAELARLEKELKWLSERTLKGEEFRAFLKHLAKESDPLQMKIITLTPHEEKPSPLEGKKGASALGYRKVNIVMVLHSTYGKLGAYLKQIERLPFLVNVDSLQIEKAEEAFPLLKVTMGLTIYIVSL